MIRRALPLLALVTASAGGVAAAAVVARGSGGATATKPRFAFTVAARRAVAGRSDRPLGRRGLSVSENWAGYAVSGQSPSGGPRHFSRVSGSWRTPAAQCTTGHASYAAFWVGLGGLALNSRALEQVGTEADCRASGTPIYYAWYELVPAAPITMRVPVAPGDVVSASVTVSGRQVRIHFADDTRGVAATLDLVVPLLDLTSAEWIAEAPSDCGVSGNNCVPLPLTNFTSVYFASARAESDGRLGGIAAWNAAAIELRNDRPTRVAYQRPLAAALPAAIPGPLAADGASFSITVKP